MELKSRLEGRIDRPKLIEYLKNDPSQKVELFTIAVNEGEPLGWRAAWMIRHVAEPKDPLLQKFLPEVINGIGSYDESKQREWLKIVVKMEVPEELQGELYDHCVNIWLDIGKHAALRISAFQWMVKLVEMYPELASEVKLLMTQEYVEALTPGIQGTFKRLAKKML